VVRLEFDSFGAAIAGLAPVDNTIYVANQSTQVTDSQVQSMAVACSKQLAIHVAPAHRMLTVPVTFLARGTVLPTAARVITVMDTLDDPQALGYHTESPGERIWGVVGTAAAMKQGAKALTGPYSISSILSHEAIELFADARINLWADTGRGTQIAVELCDPVENDSYLIDGIAVSNFVGPAWFDHLAAKGDAFDYLGKLTKPFSMSKAGYWVEMKAGKVTQRFGYEMLEWRRLQKMSEFSRAGRRVRHAA
jgi:hypothetical protein